MNRFSPLLLAAALALLSGCFGGDSRPAPRQPGLAYRDPSGDGWRLLRNAESTANHLILDLYPPATEPSGRGIMLALETPVAGALWAKVVATDPDLVRDRGVYALGAGVQARVGSRDGNRLQVALVQKGATLPAAYAATAPVLSIALDYDPVTAPAQGTPLALNLYEAFHLPPTGGKVDIAGQVRLGTLSIAEIPHRVREPQPAPVSLPETGP